MAKNKKSKLYAESDEMYENMKSKDMDKSKMKKKKKKMMMEMMDK